MSSKNWDIKKAVQQGDWTLFLDRDGVINRRLVDDYVKSWEEFEFLPGVLEAIAIFSQKFKHIFIITNQQGIGKGLMTEADLQEIHQKMSAEIKAAGGNIDAIYFCPTLAKENSPKRKPNAGMAFQAKEEFSTVNLAQSIMAGDSASDIEFGKNAGMHTVFIGEKPSSITADASYKNLISLAKAIS